MARIDHLTRVLGCESDTARAALVGMSARQWSRARSGYVGADFVANVIVALRAHEVELAARNLHVSLDELFEVVVVARDGARDQPAA